MLYLTIISPTEKLFDTSGGSLVSSELISLIFNNGEEFELVDDDFVSDIIELNISRK